MPKTPSPKILAFVEGSMERLFINNNFGYIQVIPLGNGSGWSVEAMCKQVSTLYAARNMDADKIIVWVDKEKQKCSSAEFADAIRCSLVAAGAPPERVFVCIPDRMTENIILSDEEMIRSEFADNEYTYTDDGANGKYKLSEMLRIAKHTNYKETFHGVQYLKKIRLSRCAKKNESIRDIALNINLDCWWI